MAQAPKISSLVTALGGAFVRTAWGREVHTICPVGWVILLQAFSPVLSVCHVTASVFQRLTKALGKHVQSGG